MNKQVYKLCLLGAIDQDIADFLEVDVSTVNNWKLAHCDFFDSIKKGREIADAHVAERLFCRATGYEHAEDVIMQYKGKPVIVPTVKHYPPDTTAAIFWLKNRRQWDWRERQEISGQVDVNINAIARMSEADKLDLIEKAARKIKDEMQPELLKAPDPDEAPAGPEH